MLQLSLREMAKYKAREDITDLENDSIIALKDISDEFSKLMRNFDKKKDLERHKVDLCCKDINEYKNQYEEVEFDIFYGLYCLKYLMESFLELKPTKILGVEIGNNVGLRINNPWGGIMSYEFTVPSAEDEKFYCLIKEMRKFNSCDSKIRIDLMNRLKCFVLEIIEYD